MRAVMYSLIALVLLGIGAAGGYFYGLTIGQTQAADIRTSFLQSRGLANAGGATGGSAAGTAGGSATGGAGAGNFVVGATGAGGGQGTFGSVKSISGNTIELSTAQAAIKVMVNDQTTVQQTVQQTVALSDLQPGANIVVQGERDAQGNITARSINVVPQGFGGPRRADGTPGAADAPAFSRGDGTPGAGRPGADGTPGARRQGAGAPAAAATPAP